MRMSFSTAVAVTALSQAYWEGLADLKRQDVAKIDVALLDHRRSQFARALEECKTELPLTVVAAKAGASLPPRAASCGTCGQVLGQNYAVSTRCGLPKEGGHERQFENLGTPPGIRGDGQAAGKDRVHRARRRPALHARRGHASCRVGDHSRMNLC